MKSKEELKKYLLENYKDKNGDLNLSNLDFSDFDGDIYIYNLKVKKNLIQSHQNVEGSLYQDCQTVKGNLDQSKQSVTGYFLTQTLKNDEEYKLVDDSDTYIFDTYIVKKGDRI